MTEEETKFAAFKINYIYEKWMELDQKIKEINDTPRNS
jgi:hypothetical protein